MVSGLVGSTKSAPNLFHHLDDLSKSHSQLVQLRVEKGVVEVKTKPSRATGTRVTQPGHSQLPSFQTGPTLVASPHQEKGLAHAGHAGAPPTHHRMFPTIPTTDMTLHKGLQGSVAQ